jgi:hypothetical protein
MSTCLRILEIRIYNFGKSDQKLGLDHPRVNILSGGDLSGDFLDLKKIHRLTVQHLFLGRFNVLEIFLNCLN